MAAIGILERRKVENVIINKIIAERHSKSTTHYCIKSTLRWIVVSRIIDLLGHTNNSISESALQYGIKQLCDF